MRTARFFAISLVIFAVFFLFFLTRAKIGSALRAVRGKISGEEYRALILENEALKYELEKFRKELTLSHNEFITAELYSRYPFNDGGKLIVNVGRYDSVSEGAPVLVSAGVLLGKVEKIARSQSEIKTVSDPTWRSSVFIGEKKVKAVLAGGNPPTLQFIPAAKPVEIGDRVVNASPDFPLDLFVGRVKNVEGSPQSPWLTGEVELFYTLEELDKVLIMKNFP
jgi:cell shape-determining protein MreC